MGSTTRFGLAYPELTDAPNGPAQLRELADDVDGLLSRLYRCTSSTRPLSPPNDFVIRETDTGNVMVWTGSAWSQVNGTITGGGTGGTGGGGGTSLISTASATYAATSAQPISAQSDVVVAFGVELVGDGAVVRSTQGAGHKFTLGQTRLWTVSATVRFAQNGTGGRTFEIRAGESVLAKVGADAPVNTPYTENLSATRRLAAGTAVTVIARHNAGGGLALDPSGGSYVHIDLAGV